MTDKDRETELAIEPETDRRRFLKTGATVTGVAVFGNILRTTTALASDQDQPNLDKVELLYVQNAKDVLMEKGQLRLVGINPTTIFFSDRPERIAGHMSTEDFVLDWQQGTGKESFHADPPNATLSVFGQDEIVDVVVELKNPRLAEGVLIYDTEVLEEDQQLPSGPASLFIDPIGRPLSPGSVAGVHRRHRRRRRRRIRHVVR